ncbi:MAG TPA: class I SAM-dependent methyltransferase [Verrucomicrobiae bacterium]|nr:class I SAM-dependent methyltransferase [Verrucomicrobiae bacterium]
MRTPILYTDLARYYDLIYSWKDYQKEAATIQRLITKYKRSKGYDLLEVACGTGKHIQYLKDKFRVLGTDISTGMLRVARQNIKGVRFQRADMVTLNLEKQFDVIVCLFSSIGYVKTAADLKRTLLNFGGHLKKGGVVIIEPWLTKEIFKKGLPHMTTYGDDDIKIARLDVSKARGNVSILEMHYLVAEKDKTVRHFVDRHELSMFEPRQILRFMRQAGLRAKFVRNGLMKGRGLYIGVK